MKIQYGAAVLVGFFFLFCAIEEPKMVALKYPLKSMKIWPDGNLHIETANDICLSDLVDLSYFIDKGFWPGISIEEAEEVYGPPDFKYNARSERDSVYGYIVNNGSIEIIKQHVVSEGAELERWFLRLDVKDDVDIVDKEILKQREFAHGRQNKMRIKIFSGPGGNAVADLDFFDKELKYLWWKAQSDVGCKN